MAWRFGALIGLAFFTCCSSETQPSHPHPNEAKPQFVSGERPVGDVQEMFGTPDKSMHPAIYDPEWIAPNEASFLRDEDVVFVLRSKTGKTRVYPQVLLGLHHVVNDTLDGSRVAVTYCMMADSAILYSHSSPLAALGSLIYGNLVMYDGETGSYWTQLRGDCFHGERRGEYLTNVGALDRVNWKTAKAWPSVSVLRPEGKVHHYRDFFKRVKGGKLGLEFLRKSKKPDPRLPPFSQGLGVVVRGQARFFPTSAIQRAGFLQATVGGWSLLLAFDPETGSTRMFRRYLSGRTLDFERVGGRLTDRATKSAWNLEGVCLEGELKGAKLARPVYTQAFWYSWAAFFPTTSIANGPPDGS